MPLRYIAHIAYYFSLSLLWRFFTKEFSKGSDRKRLLQAIETKYIKTEVIDLAESRTSSKLLIPRRLMPMIYEGEVLVEI